VVRSRNRVLRAPQSAPKGEKKSKTPALDHFCRDLTPAWPRKDSSIRPSGGARKFQRVMEVPDAPQEEQSGAHR
jgi:hypothetical protein